MPMQGMDIVCSKDVSSQRFSVSSPHCQSGMGLWFPTLPLANTQSSTEWVLGSSVSSKGLQHQYQGQLYLSVKLVWQQGIQFNSLKIYIFLIGKGNIYQSIQRYHIIQLMPSYVDYFGIYPEFFKTS